MSRRVRKNAQWEAPIQLIAIIDVFLRLAWRQAQAALVNLREESFSEVFDELPVLDRIVSLRDNMDGAERKLRVVLKCETWESTEVHGVAAPAWYRAAYADPHTLLAGECAFYRQNQSQRLQLLRYSPDCPAVPRKNRHPAIGLHFFLDRYVADTDVQEGRARLEQAFEFLRREAYRIATHEWEHIRQFELRSVLSHADELWYEDRWWEQDAMALDLAQTLLDGFRAGDLTSPVTAEHAIIALRNIRPDLWEDTHSHPMIVLVVMRALQYLDGVLPVEGVRWQP